MPCATSKKDTCKDAEREGNGFRMVVEDTFSVEDGCFVVFGTVQTGIIKVGDEIEIVTKDDQHMSAIVEALESHRRLIEKASVGEHVAVSIRNKAASGEYLKNSIHRGDILYIAEEVLAGTTVHVPKEVRKPSTLMTPKTRIPVHEPMFVANETGNVGVHEVPPLKPEIPKEKQMSFFDRFKKGKKTEPNPTPSQGKSIANTGITAMLRSGVERRIAKLPNDESGQATRSILSRICQPEWLAIISSTLSTKMSDAFQDDELHSLGLSRDGIYVLMYAFPCSPKHALKTVYKNGYAHYIGNAVTDWLRDSLTGVATLLHVQLFSDVNSLSLHLTVFPVHAQDPLMIVFPAELLTTNDRNNLTQLQIKEKTVPAVTDKQ